MRGDVRGTRHGDSKSLALGFLLNPLYSIFAFVYQGLVISAGKMTNTIVIRRDYLHYISKYRR